MNEEGFGGLPPFAEKPPGLEKFSHEQILKFGEMLRQGIVPKELEGMLQGTGVDADGNPILDKEGGAVVQPQAGFVVKTQAKGVGKIFVNMCQHEWVEGFSVQQIPKED